MLPDAPACWCKGVLDGAFGARLGVRSKAGHSEQGWQAQQSHGGLLARFDHQVVRNAGSGESVKQQVDTLLRDFSSNPRECGRRLTALLRTDPVTFRRCVVEYLSNGAQDVSARYVVGLLDRESNLLDLLLDPGTASLSQAKKVAKLVNQSVPHLDVDLAKALSRAGDHQSNRILQLLAEVADSNRTLPLLMRVLRERGPKLRASAARILSQHCQSELFVQAALGNSDAAVRAGAIEGIGLRGSKLAPALLKTAMNDRDPHVRTHALLAAFRLGEEGAVEGLLALARHKRAETRALTAWAMGETRDERFLPTLAAFALDTESDVRSSAERARQRIKSPPELSAQQDGAAPIKGVSPEEQAPNREITIDLIRARFSDEGEALLYVGVQPPKGVSIEPLAAEDFSVQVDGRPIPNLELTAPSDQRPLNVALVFDYSDRMPATNVMEMRTAALGAIRKKRTIDRFALFKFSVDVNKTPFSPDPKRLAALVRGPYVGGRKACRLHDSLGEAARALGTQDGERAVIIVAAGGDRGSELSLWKTVLLLEESGAFVFAVQYGQGKEVRALRELSADTGGGYFRCNRGTELTHTLQEVVEGLLSCYRLRYLSEIRPERDIRLHIATSLGAAEALIPLGDGASSRADRKAS